MYRLKSDSAIVELLKQVDTATDNWNDVWCKRAARKQTDASTYARDEPRTADSHNIWSGRKLGEVGNLRKKEHAKTRCVPQLDCGRTRGSGGGATTFCIYFAKGCCTAGFTCPYLHRIPIAVDEQRCQRDMGMDIFGREKRGMNEGYRKGAGTFERDNRTLYILYEGAGSYDVPKIRQLLTDNFCEWGTVNNIYIVPSKLIAFVRYDWRSAAEFAKEAMNCQSFRGSTLGETLTVRWANEDPNPIAIAAYKRYCEEVFADTVVQAWEALPPEQKRARIMNLEMEAALKKGAVIASYPDTAEQFTEAGLNLPAAPAMLALEAPPSGDVDGSTAGHGTGSWPVAPTMLALGAPPSGGNDGRTASQGAGSEPAALPISTVGAPSGRGNDDSMAETGAGNGPDARAATMAEIPQSKDNGSAAAHSGAEAMTTGSEQLAERVFRSEGRTEDLAGAEQGNAEIGTAATAGASTTYASSGGQYYGVDGVLYDGSGYYGSSGAYGYNPGYGTTSYGNGGASYSAGYGTGYGAQYPDQNGTSSTVAYSYGDSYDYYRGALESSGYSTFLRNPSVSTSQSGQPSRPIHAGSSEAVPAANASNSAAEEPRKSVGVSDSLGTLLAGYGSDEEDGT